MILRKRKKRERDRKREKERKWNWNNFNTLGSESTSSIKISLIFPSCPPSNSDSKSLVGFVALCTADTLSGTGVSIIFGCKVDLWLGLRRFT